ncbi:MAG: hypothetical protein HETSPECPRED_009905 [Heterodermia speciosa]|uniref:Uncharacterized protein n=1 Tax=Heterodermia speciosa TaxID=116794 RepID=A0A8H3G753_9LECA|nr:MAG: hypothetical protein HETSPECPRED_009905 [Heterodermia speciosa]
MARWRSFLPAHVLHAIANSVENPQNVQEAAQTALQIHQRVTLARKEYLLTEGKAGVAQPADAFIPSHAVARISDDAGAKGLIQGTGAVEADVTDSVSRRNAPLETKPTSRTVCDFNHALDEYILPGIAVRANSSKESPDKTVNQAYDNVGQVLKFYKEKLGLESFDNENTAIVSSVHFGKDYVNAYGNDFIYNFAASVDVIAHEISHALTDNLCPLEYSGQSGALNEHLSDVLAVIVGQMVKNQTAEQANWLIGEDCLFPTVRGVALRSLKAPGTAYDDPRLVSNAKDFRVAEEDNGGVHTYSGIPNKAFYLTAMALGGSTWGTAGRIWWSAMRSGRIPLKCSFQQFADLTIQCATTELGHDAAKLVRRAWDDVGVIGGV